MMPKVIGNDSLIARVNEVQGRMYRQSNELGRLNKAVRRYKEENAKLRELVRNALVFITYSGCGIDEPYEGFTTANRFCEDCRHFDTNTCAYVITQDAIELGIEVG